MFSFYVFKKEITVPLRGDYENRIGLLSQAGLLLH